jgi:hypothetical protein
VKAVLTEAAAISIGKGAAPVGTSGSLVALAPVGAEPGSVMVNTTQVTGKITAVDAGRRKVTYRLPDGSTATVKAGKDVNVAALSPGDDVTITLAEGLVISAEKP